MSDLPPPPGDEAFPPVPSLPTLTELPEPPQEELPPPPPPAPEDDFVPPPPPPADDGEEPPPPPMDAPPPQTVTAPSRVALRTKTKKKWDKVKSSSKVLKKSGKNGASGFAGVVKQKQKQTRGRSRTLGRPKGKARRKSILRQSNKRPMAAKRNVFLEQKFTKSFDEIKKNQVSVLTHASVPVTDLMGKHDAADYGHVFTEQGYHTSSDLAEDFAWLVLELSHDVPVDVLQSMFGKLTHTEGPYEKNTFMGYSARENSAVARLMGARGKMVR